MNDEINKKLRTYIGLAYRSKSLFHSSSLIDKVYKNKIRLIIVNKKISKYLNKALENKKDIAIVECDIEQILNKMCDLYDVDCIGIQNIHLAKAIRDELLKKEV